MHKKMLLWRLLLLYSHPCSAYWLFFFFFQHFWLFFTSSSAYNQEQSTSQSMTFKIIIQHTLSRNALPHHMTSINYMTYTVTSDNRNCHSWQIKFLNNNTTPLLDWDTQKYVRKLETICVLLLQHSPIRNYLKLFEVRNYLCPVQHSPLETIRNYLKLETICVLLQHSPSLHLDTHTHRQESFAGCGKHNALET